MTKNEAGMPEYIDVYMMPFDGDYLLAFGEPPKGGVGAKYVRADIAAKDTEGLVDGCKWCGGTGFGRSPDYCEMCDATVEQDKRSFKKCIAEAAICLLSPNIAITDTVWMNDKTNCTLYEHLVSYLDVELTGDIDEDIKLLNAFKAGGVDG